MSERFEVRFEVEFSLDDATKRVLYMDWVFGPEDSVRNSRLAPDSFVPYIPSAEPPTTTTLAPTTTPVAPATTAASTTTPAQPTDNDAGFPWAWLALPAALVAAAAGWALGRRKQADRP